MAVSHTLAQLEASGVHVTFPARLPGPWGRGRAALVTRWPDDSWFAQVAATAPQAAVTAALDRIAALRRYGAGNAGWTPGPGGTLWAFI